MSREPLYTIKQVSQLTGVPPATLRKWEERYRIVTPVRLPNGYRGYTDQDVALLRWVKERVRQGALVNMVAREARERLQHGWDPAAELAVPGPSRPADQPEQPEPPRLAQLRTALSEELIAVREAAARSALEELFALFSVETVLAEVIEPVLHDLGDLWARGRISDYQEHFASNLIRERLSALRSLLPAGAGPRLLVSCLPGESHEIGLLVLSILAQRQGFAVTYLGASPSADGLCRAVVGLHPRYVCLSAASPRRLQEALPALRTLVQATREMEPPPEIVVGGLGVQALEQLPALSGVTFTPQPARNALQRLVADLQ